MANHRAAKELHGSVLLCQGKLCHLEALGMTRHHTTLRGVGRLFYPPAECQSSPVDKIQQLRHGICSVLRMQKRIRQRGLLLKIRGQAQQSFQADDQVATSKRSDQFPIPSSVARMPTRLQNSCNM